MPKEIKKEVFKIFSQKGFIFIFASMLIIFLLVNVSLAFVNPEVYLVPIETENTENIYAVSLKLSNAINVVKLSTEVKYSEENIKYDHIETRGLFVQKKCIYTITPDPGSLKILAHCMQGQTVDGDTDIADIYFQAKKTGEASLAATNSTLAGLFGMVYTSQAGAVSMAVIAPDTKAPEIFDNGSSGGLLPANLEEATISVKTDENAICKFSQNIETIFDNMENTLSGEELLHSAKISGLQEGMQYKFYVKCRDASLNVSPNFFISFSVDKNNPSLSIDPQSATINKDAKVLTKILYGDLKNISNMSFDIVFDAAIISYDHIEANSFLSLSCNLKNKIKQSGVLNIIVDCAGHPLSGSGEVAMIYFLGKSKGTSGLEITSASLFDNSYVPKEIIADIKNGTIKVLESENSAPQITNGLPQGSLSANTAEVALSVETDEAATCKYSAQAEKSYQEMESNFELTGGKNHSKKITGLNGNHAYAYYVKCRDDFGNTSQDYAINFSIDELFPTVAIAPQNGSVNAGGACAAKINISYVNNLKSFVSYVSYDNTILSYDHFVKSESLNNGCNFSVAAATQGKLKVFLDCASPFAGGEIALIYLNAKAAGNTSLAFSEGHLYDNAFLANEIEAHWKGSAVNVLASDVLPPNILSGHDQGVFAAGTEQVVLKLETNEDAFCRLSDSENISFPSMDYEFDQTGSRIHLALLSGMESGYDYVLFAKCRDMSGNATSDFKLYFGVEGYSNGGNSGNGTNTGGGGSATGGSSGGGSVIFPESDTGNSADRNDIAGNSTTTSELGKSTSAAQKIQPAKINLAQYNDEVYKKEAGIILGWHKWVELSSAEQEAYSRLMKKIKSAGDSFKYQAASFIKLGTQTTKKLGAGERAGVINSYQAAFGSMPANESEWIDIIRIANGRWPIKRNSEKEKDAGKLFKKIYLREADRSNVHDDAAITLMSYGLRPAKRNLKAEIPAITYFKNIFKHAPSTSEDWDTVRAIAYSGAKR